MIKIPVCFFCKYYNFDTETCKAYPNGMPNGMLGHKKRDDKECNNGFKFEERK